METDVTTTPEEEDLSYAFNLNAVALGAAGLETQHPLLTPMAIAPPSVRLTEVLASTERLRSQHYECFAHLARPERPNLGVGGGQFDSLSWADIAGSPAPSAYATLLGQIRRLPIAQTTLALRGKLKGLPPEDRKALVLAIPPHVTQVDISANGIGQWCVYEVRLLAEGIRALGGDVCFDLRDNFDGVAYPHLHDAVAPCFVGMQRKLRLGHSLAARAVRRGVFDTYRGLLAAKGLFGRPSQADGDVRAPEPLSTMVLSFL